MTTEPNLTPVKIETWLAVHAERAGQVSDSGLHDLRVLLAERMGQTRTWVSAHPETEIPPQLLEQLNDDLRALFAGKPLAYLLGHKEFHLYDFFVTPDVLVPRPETELLVETAIAWLESHPPYRRGWDVGTGSGCIPISLALSVRGLVMDAYEISPAALAVAARNVAKYQVGERVHLIQSDLLAMAGNPLPGLVTANLPYIPSQDAAVLPVAQHEPLLALDGGPDGLDLVRRLMRQLVTKQADPEAEKNYLYLFEIEYRQLDAALALAVETFPGTDSAVVHDYAGKPRLLQIRGGK
jgi:release factor glutamine methyltransferase